MGDAEVEKELFLWLKRVNKYRFAHCPDGVLLCNLQQETFF